MVDKSLEKLPFFSPSLSSYMYLTHSHTCEHSFCKRCEDLVHAAEEEPGYMLRRIYFKICVQTSLNKKKK